MMRSILAIAMCAISALSTWPVSAAQRAPAKKDFPVFSQSGAAMKTGESYYITYTCNVKVELREYLKKKGGVLRVNPITAATLVVAVVDGTTNVESGLFVAGQAINPKVVFSVQSDKGVMATNEPNSCNGSMIAQGSDMPKLAYLLKFQRQTVPSAISTAVSTLLTMVGPIFKLVKDNPISEKDAENVEQVQTVINTYNSYLALFTAPESISKAPFLKVGRNILETEAATVQVNVRKVDSFLLDEKVPFTDDYQKLFKANTTYVADNLSGSCQFARVALATAGFRNPDDQAYIHYRSLNASLIKSEDDFVTCLGPALVRSVVDNRRLYLKHFPDSLVLSEATLKKISVRTEDEILDVKVKGILHNIATIAGSSVSGTIPQDRVTAFEPLAESTITVNDFSGGQILSPGQPPATIKSTTNGTAAEQFSKLVAAKYTKFGCFSVTRSEKALDGLLDGATAVMLATSPATKVEAARTVTLRLFFNGTKLKRFDITDNWISETRAAYAKDGRACPI